MMVDLIDLVFVFSVYIVFYFCWCGSGDEWVNLMWKWEDSKIVGLVCGVYNVLSFWVLFGLDLRVIC